MFFKKTMDPPPEDPILGELRTRITQAGLPETAAEVAIKELSKLEKTDPAVAEYSIGLNYIDYILALPWSRGTTDNLDLARAREILERRHHGLTQVKERVMEFLAAKTLCHLRTRRVLVVDDEEIARTNLEYAFGKDGWRTQAAANGIQALEMIERVGFDVVVTDLKMGQMDGMQLLTAIRRLAPETEVVMVTGYGTVDSAVAALRQGAAHYLCKPVNLNELRRTVREILDRKRHIQMTRGPVLCFAGPPGTGKTSIGRGVAEALERKFVRFSVAGLRDEAEFRGHRRTYVGALPGRITKELKTLGVMNPVFMLDEIDKIGQDFRGDPASVLLEVLDPEQNNHFVDLYLDLPFDLSRVMFIATANAVERLPGPLLDRMEVIAFPSYTEREKLTIARRFVVPAQLTDNGLDRQAVTFTDEAVLAIIQDYTREAGLRGLEREIGGVCRKLARMAIEGGMESGPGTGPVVVDLDLVHRLLGPRKFTREAAEAESRVGVTTGLVWSEFGGEIIFVETTRMKGSQQLILTGSLGEVLRESAQTALSYVRGRAAELGLAPDFFDQLDVHIHFPAGSVAKDGPSAGVTIVLALISLLTGRPARSTVAMSGEVTLSGRLLPVSGLREKLLAARRGGVTRVILPKRNQTEVEVLPADVTEGLEIILAGEVIEVIDLVLV